MNYIIRPTHWHENHPDDEWVVMQDKPYNYGVVNPSEVKYEGNLNDAREWANEQGLQFEVVWQ